MKSGAYLIIAYGLFVILGGIMGYQKANSVPSLVMGAIFGILLIISSVAMLKENMPGFYIAISLTVILMLFFAYRFFVTQNFMPAGMMSMVSCLVAIVTYFLVKK